MAKKYEYGPEIRITAVNADLINDLNNIAENLGHKTLNAFLRPELRKIRDSYPEKMRQKPKD